jgi:hypothetical protein
MIDKLQARLRQVLARARLFRQHRGLDPFSARRRDLQKFECEPVVDCDPLRGFCPECLAEWMAPRRA